MKISSKTNASEDLKGNLKASNIVDDAFGQGIITVNEYRALIGLPPFEGGDVTVTKKTLLEEWSST